MQTTLVGYVTKDEGAAFYDGGDISFGDWHITENDIIIVNDGSKCHAVAIDEPLDEDTIDKFSLLHGIWMDIDESRFFCSGDVEPISVIEMLIEYGEEHKCLAKGDNFSDYTE